MREAIFINEAKKKSCQKLLDDKATTTTHKNAVNWKTKTSIYGLLLMCFYALLFYLFLSLNRHRRQRRLTAVEKL